MPRPSLVIVIVEDDHHEMLVRRYLRKRGMELHQVRFERSPSGQGSAEGWVRTKYAKEVTAYRNRQARAATALIVMIDADTHTVQGRLAQLSQALAEHGIQPIDNNENNEHVVQLVPKRNVETWILCLTQQVVDEEEDYKQRSHEWKKLIPRASEVLFQWTRSNAALPNHCIDSLRHGVSELKRLQF